MLKKIFIIVACLTLQACAHQAELRQYGEGKASFTSGDYKQAFHQLLPLAVADDARAQYAVGYMYYYGYGVTQDSESGMFWMQKAATQNYAPAQKALDLIAKTQNYGSHRK